LFLVWEVITRSLVAYLADTDVSPEAALRLRSTDPNALVNLADKRLDLGPTIKVLEPVRSPPPDEANTPVHANNDQPASAKVASTDINPKASAQVRSLAEIAVLNDPLNSHAFRILGQLSQSTSDEARTKTLMQAAVRRSLFESNAVYWMMLKSYRDQDYSAAIRYADALLRTHPGDPRPSMQVLGRILENSSASGKLKSLLASNPPWREKFFDYLPDNILDARTPLDVLLSLKDTPTPPSAKDINRYLDLLISHGFYDLAYYAWLQFLPAEQLSKVAQLFNGNFEAPLSGQPFDWVFREGPGVTIQIAERPDASGDHALLVEFGDGRVNDFGVTQLIMLSPGTYQIRGKSKIDVVSQRGLRWQIACAPEPKPVIGESQTVNGTGSGWKDFDFSFTVPSTDCPAQYVQLILDARSASEQFVSGSIEYDDLEIVRDASADLRPEP
jgi:hypothetical protein